MLSDSKLYIIVRADLPPGAQAAQACHAFRQFQEQHAELERAWFLTSNNLVLLQAPDERALDRLVGQARQQGIPYAVFLEPDFAGSMTAITLAPSGARLVSCLPLALRPKTAAAGRTTLQDISPA
jgi:peptidyl-tRNA hydrolase